MLHLAIILGFATLCIASILLFEALAKSKRVRAKAFVFFMLGLVVTMAMSCSSYTCPTYAKSMESAEQHC